MTKLSRKMQRAADFDISMLLKPKEWMTDIRALNELELIERLEREIKIPNHRPIYLSEKAYISFIRLVDTIESLLEKRHLLEKADVQSACKTVLGDLCLRESPSISVSCFLKELDGVVNSLIGKYKFCTTVTGLYFEDFLDLDLGKLKIQRPDLKLLQQCIASEDLVRDTWENMKRDLWVTGEIIGSKAYAERCFFEYVETICGLLALSFTTVLERGGVAVRLLPSMDGRTQPKTNRWFSFSTEKKLLCTTMSMQSCQDVALNKKQADAMLRCEWFQNIIKVIQGGQKNDIEQAVGRGVYWFFDAQADMKTEMKLVKFWSCIECFFSFGKDGKTTEKIKRGVSTILTCGSYSFSPYAQWKKLEKEVDDLYDLRCGAVHDAKHSHVKECHVTTVSKWAAWIMLEISNLNSQGFETREAIKIEIDRVYDLFQERSIKPE